MIYDETTGDINVTDTQTSCEGAAQPDVEEEYKYSCVECDLDYYDGGISVTALFPVDPVPLGNADDVGNTDIGITLNGITLSAPAPVSDILANYTIAAFDDCGGHVNQHQGYHYHGTLHRNTSTG